jgi:hypothetical protein
MMQVGPAIVRDAAEQNVVVTTLDNVDGVDLHVPQVLDRGLHGALAGAEGFALVETLSVEPDATGISPGDRNRTHLPLSHIPLREALVCNVEFRHRTQLALSADHVAHGASASEDLGQEKARGGGSRRTQAHP